MALNRRKLRGLIEYSDLRNADGLYTEDDVIGVSTDKCMIPTKANLSGVNLKAYKLFEPGSFAFVADTSRRGDKMALAYNDTERTFIVSTWYVVFRVVDSALNELLPDYLYLFFNRPEFDRYARANSWGSAREYFWFTDMEDLELDLPPIDIQQKYIDIYSALKANQASYEKGLDDFKTVCDGELDRCKETSQWVRLGDLLTEIDQRNTDLRCNVAHGLNIQKQFMISAASADDLRKYKLVAPNQFAYSSMQTGRDKCIRISLNGGTDYMAVSPAYSILECTDSSVLAEYIMMWMSRSETDRLGWFCSDGSIRANLDLNRFYDIEIPKPSADIQKSLVNLYFVLQERRRINEELKQHIKQVAPILIKGAVDEARR